MRCSILLADSSAGVLLSGAAPSLPLAYTRAIDRLPIAEGVGSCGTAAARRETVIVSDIARSPLWRDYTDLAQAHGLAACWSAPLIDSSGELLGTSAMYYAEPRSPTAAEEDLIRVVGSLAAMVIQRHRDTERLHASEARYRSLAETCPDAVFVHDYGRIIYANKAAAELLHLQDVASIVSQRLDRFVRPECQHDVLAHRRGMLAARLQRSDGAIIYVEIVATQIMLDERTKTLLICRDVTERLTLEHELLDIASREQTHLAHDLHDGLGQQLTGMALFLRGMTNHFVPLLPELGADFERINALVSKSIEDTRRLAAGMSPMAVERAGLAGALAGLAAQAAELYGSQVDLDIDSLRACAIDHRVVEHLYRIAQEAVSNVGRHAGSKRINIAVHIAGADLCLSIADDGIGLPEPTHWGELPGGLGLRIMRYRAQRIGGTLCIERGSPQGTVIRVCCPVRDVGDTSRAAGS
jgi:PAS domain S-box-containing protein